MTATRSRLTALAIGVFVALALITTSVTIANAGLPGQPTETESPDPSETTTDPTETPTASESPEPGGTESESPIPGLPGGDDEVTGERLGGVTRIETAVEISQFGFPEGSEVVYLARADNFPDSLAAGALTGGPILLVPQCGDLPEVVAEEIERLSPSTVYALGGTDAVCEDMLDQAVEAAQASDEPSEEPTETESPAPEPTETTSPAPTETETEGGGLPPLFPSESETASPAPTETATP